MRLVLHPRRRVWVEGGGSQAGAALSAGQTQIPVFDATWYSPAGGLVVSGPQRITYGGVVAGGAGALIGTTITPTNGPIVTPRTATGLSAGTYGWAVTFGTATGETKPSPATSLTLGGFVAAPATVPTLTRAAGGNLSDGVYQWKTTFVDFNGGETTPSTAASVTLGDAASDPAAIGALSGGTDDSNSQLNGAGTYYWGFTFRRLADGAETALSPTRSASGPWSPGQSYVTIALSGSTTPPAGYVRQWYRTVNSGSTFKRVIQDGSMIGSVPQGTEVGGYFYDHSSDASLGATAPASNGTAYHQATLTAIPVSSDPNVVSRKVYRTVANGSTFKLLTTIANNTATTYADNTADGSLGATAPTSSTALYLAANLSSIPVGPSGTTSRKVYRTVANGSTYKFLTTIANNTTTTFADTTADGSLGATAPSSDTSGLVAQGGDVPAGSTSVLVTSTAPFEAAGGWAFIGALGIRYTGVSGDALTGVPASGVGALTTTVRYGSEVIAASMLTGIPSSGAGSILYDILGGDDVNLLVRCDDVVAQAELAALEGGDSDGIYEYYVQDRRLSEGEARAVGNADLALFSRPIETLRYETRDPKTRTGQTVHVDLPALGISGDFMIQSVRIIPIPNQWPRFSVEASTVRFSFEDVLRRLHVTS